MEADANRQPLLLPQVPRGEPAVARRYVNLKIMTIKRELIRR